ncbi:hypothetical protein Tco_1255457 [Tanacetum coccineum]
MTDKDSSAEGSKPMTPYVHTRPANNEIIPFYDNIKNLSHNLATDINTEVKEFERCLDKIESKYDQCLADNIRLDDTNKRLRAKTRRLQKLMTNLWNDNEHFIADNIAKDIYSFVLSSKKEVSLRTTCRCEELQSNCDKEHSRVLELEAEVLEKQQMLAKSEHQSSYIQKQFVDLQLKFQNYKERLRHQKVCEKPNATASNAIFEINQLKDQLQRKDDTIRNLESQINIMKMLNIQNNGYKTENANVNRRYLELSKENTHLRTTSTEKLDALKSEIAKLKAEAVGKKNSGPTEPEKPKVLASMMYTKSSKYIVPPKRANWVQPTPLLKKKQVTFPKPHRTSPRSTQKPLVQQHKKPTVPVNVFPKSKPATAARKPIPNHNTRNHQTMPSKSVKARRAADYNRNLYVDIGQFVVRSTRSVNTKPPQAKCVVNTSRNAWKETKKEVARIVPKWKPTGR